jgi:hypothetical protein
VVDVCRRRTVISRDLTLLSPCYPSIQRLLTGEDFVGRVMALHWTITLEDACEDRQ